MHNPTDTAELYRAYLYTQTGTFGSTDTGVDDPLPNNEELARLILEANMVNDDRQANLVRNYEGLLSVMRPQHACACCGRVRLPSIPTRTDAHRDFALLADDTARDREDVVVATPLEDLAVLRYNEVALQRLLRIPAEYRNVVSYYEDRRHVVDAGASMCMCHT